METAVVSGVAHSKSEAKITVVKVPTARDRGEDLQAAVEANIVVDVIVQNVSITGSRT